MNNKAIKIWQQLPDSDKQDIFNEVAAKKNLPAAAIEKDWWVVRTLQYVFETSIAHHTVFKGGTSLSKAWGLIDRFSEDIDLALDRKFLGFNKTDQVMTASQVRKLREKSSRFITEVYYPELKKKFSESGFENVKILLRDAETKDQDPLIIEINYPSVTEVVSYLQPRVLLEIGSRSMMEPFELRSFTSFVGEQFNGRSFADEPITIPTVNPERTFLEKIFLIHEEFQQPSGKIKVGRKSRHLYDLEKLMDTTFADTALSNKELYKTIVAHRRTLTPIRGIDYANHKTEKIDPIPPAEIIGEWEKDYVAMQQSMLYNPSLPFDKLMERIIILRTRINKLNFNH